jgi:hypothetical protein
MKMNKFLIAKAVLMISFSVLAILFVGQNRIQGQTVSGSQTSLSLPKTPSKSDLSGAISVAENVQANSVNDTSISRRALEIAVKNAQLIMQDNNATANQIFTVYRSLSAAVNSMTVGDHNLHRYSTVPVGKTWLDTEGSPIQAHGGSVLKQKGTNGQTVYYWVGEDKTHNGASFNGVNLYKSTDLMNWTYVNTILAPDFSNPALSNCKIERPKLIYNAKTHQYVLWGHWEDQSNYISSQVCVATSSSVDGPYKFLGHWRPGADAGHRDWRVATDGSNRTTSFDNGTVIQNYSYDDTNIWGTGSRDFTIFQDGNKAYLVSAEDGNTMRIYELNSDFTDVDKNAMNSYELQVNAKREAATLVKSGQYYFMISSNQTGWYPNQARYAYTKNLSNPDGWHFKKEGNAQMPANYLGNNTTFYSQATNVITVNGTKQTSYIYVGDHWNTKQLGNSSYVWLPLKITGTSGNHPSLQMNNVPGWSIDQKTGLVKVPKDKLLSQNKPAVSDASGDNDLSYSLFEANDGIYYNTNISGNSSNYFKPTKVPFTYTVDLQKNDDLSRVDISFNTKVGADAYYQYTIETSTDGKTWTKQVDESANQQVGFNSDKLNGRARYVRLTVNNVVNDQTNQPDPDQAGIVEFQVYGK